MEQQIIAKLHKHFEEYAHTQDGVEFWYARDLQKLLGYDEWRNFEGVVQKAKIACGTAQQKVSDHFVGVNKMVSLGSGSKREIQDIMLTRYACYLIAQNGDPFARIRSQGDKTLFGGYTTQEMKSKLNVAGNRPLADFLPAVTVKAKDLANEITNHNMKQNPSLQGETPIAYEHVKNNRNMRDMLVKSGIYPEALPAEEDIKKVERRLKSERKKLPKAVKKLKTVR